MVCAKLETVLDENEISELSENIKNKINEVLQSQSQLIDELKNESSELSAVSERQQFQFEKEIFDTQERLKESSDQCLQLKTQLAKLEESLNSSQKKCRELQSNHDATVLELQSVKKSNDLLCKEKKGLVDQLEKTRLEVEKLNGEVKNLLDQTSAANDARCEAIAASEAAKMKESNLQHQVKRLELEKELLNKQISDLNTEVSQKNHEIHTLKREKSTNVLELQMQLEQNIDEVHLLQKQVADLKKSNEEKDRRVEALAERIRGMNQSHTEAEEQFQLELRAQTKLADLYKQSSEDAQQRVQELVRGFEELQKMLRETQESHEALAVSKNEMEENFKSQLESKEEQLAKLNEELKNANDLLTQNKGMTPERLEIMFPTAAATSKVLRSGMTLTQMYSEYIKAQEEVQQQKNENLRLAQQLQQIVGEIQENTPVINQRMQEYHKAVETISCLRTQLASSLTDQEHLQSERDDAKRLNDQMERENARLRSQVSDLNHQVQHLLKEVEESRGGRVRLGNRSSGDQEVSSTDEVTANKVISRHLVTFRDIEDIQTKNQQLLAVVRELSKQQEEIEKSHAAEDLAKLQKEFEKASVQLEEMQQARVKQAEMVETIIRQRDMYRVLLSNQGYSESLLGSSFTASTPLSGEKKTSLSPRDIRLQEARSALKQLQLEFDSYKKEKAENTKMLNEQLEKLRDETSDLRIKTAKLNSQLEYADERFNLLQTNLENFKKENASLREKNQKHTTLVAQHQQTINTLRQDMMVAHEKLAKAEVAVENLKAERELLKGVEARLLQEKEALMREQQQQSRVLSNLQTVQNNLERIESETQRNLKFQLEKFEKETAMLRTKLENSNEEYRSAVKVWEKETKELQQKVDKEVERNRKLHEDLVDAYADVHKLKQEIISVRCKVVTSEAQLEKKTVIEPWKTHQQLHALSNENKQTTQSANSSAEIKKLKDQLNESENKFKALREKMELTQKSSEHYLNVANELELRVKEQDEINKQLKEEMEKSLEQSYSAKENLEKSMEDMEKTNRKLIEDNMKLSQENSNKYEDLLKKISTLEKELEVALRAKDEAEKIAIQAREDCQNQLKFMQEAQDKYERELLLHAEDVQQLYSVKEQYQECQKQLAEIQSKQNEKEQALVDSRASWAEREKMLLEEQKSLTDHITELQKQNEHILHQLELMGTQMASLKGKDWNVEPSTSVSEGEVRDTHHLVQVVQFIRKEKEIAIAQFDAAQSENIRLKMKTEQLSSELSLLKSELNEFQQISQAQASSDAQHADFLRKIEMMNLLTESNKLLRSEKDVLQESTKELEEKIKQLESIVCPLQAENKEISSQLEVLTSENAVLRTEMKSWQSRTNQLLEQSHKIGPQEYKNLTKELEELKRQKAMLAEELQKKQSEAIHLNTTVSQLMKNLETSQNERAEVEIEVSKKVNEYAELQKTMVQVKKIGRKYKAQYDELKFTYDELVARTSAAADSPAQEQILQEAQKKFQDMETEFREEISKLKETATKAEKEVESIMSQSSEKDEKAKKLLGQVRQKYSQLCSQKDTLLSQNNNQSKEIAEMKARINSLVQSSEEESARVTCLKNQLESKIASLEKELSTSKETIAELEKRNEELNQKVAQQQKHGAKSTVALTERGSGPSSEPLTANIKPLATPAPTSVSGGLRHSVHPHVAVAAPSARSTPTASIRPMAIGSVASSSGQQTRMAAVLPTTVTAVTPTVEEADIPSVPVQPSTVPQATVQPTPVTATATPVRTTVAATGTLQSHPPVISEVSLTAVGEAESSPIPGEPVQSHLISSAGPNVSSPATALVSPRIEGADSSPEGLSVDTPAPTTSVIVSPPATQVVTPTVKRPREEIESPGPSECTDSGVHMPQKRVRMISEGSQTNQQLPSASTTASNVAVATVVSRKMPSEMAVSEPQSEARDKQQFADPHSSASTHTSDAEACSSKSTEKDSPEEIEVKQVLEWEIIEIPEKPADIEIEEVMDDDPAEDFEDMQEVVTFSSRSVEDEDMVDDSNEESVEMPDQQPNDCIEIIEVGESSNSDNKMEADSSSLQAPPSDQTMAPPAHPITQDITPVRMESSSSTATPEPSSVHSSHSHAQRPPLLPRVPSRQERLPSTVRQNLTPFTIPGQGTDEGDDSIVPSTPTLFVPPRSDGFAEAVSSPHVPQERFLFLSSEGGSPSQQGLSQLASQGALGVDDTRMDLSQFDEGGGRTVPSTPLHVSPPDAVEPEVLELSVPEQPSSSHIRDLTVPTIKVDAPEASGTDVCESVEQTEQSKLTPQSLSTEVNPTQDDFQPSEEDKEVKESQSVITSVATSDGDGVSGAPSQSASVDEQKANINVKDGSGGTEETDDAQTSGPSQSQSQQRKPIVWKEGNKRSPSPQPTQFPPPSAHPPPPAPRASRSQRGGRRIRFRGSGGYSRPLRSWGPQRRGHGGQGGRMF